MEQSRNKEGLRRGWTTGTCAQAASLAAARALLEGRIPRLAAGEEWNVTVHLPGGRPFTLPVSEGQEAGRKDQEKLTAVRCAVRKDSGDDPDVTNGILVYSTVSLLPGQEIRIDGGRGVGRVTRPGLAVPVGQAAINPVPRRMIREELTALRDEAGYEGGFSVLIEIPEGEELAARTFNPRLGIKGGISVLGTSGIVEPMSEKALIDTIEVEIKVKLAEGRHYLIAAPGNYGLDFLESRWKISPEETVKCSNYIGETIDLALEHGARGLLFTGHIGKLVKLAGGIMNTHSRQADCRMELMAAAAFRGGVPVEKAGRLLSCNTTEDALGILDEKEREQMAAALLERIETYLAIRAGSRPGRTMMTGAVLFSSRYGLLGMTRHAGELLEAAKNRK